MGLGDHGGGARTSAIRKKKGCAAVEEVQSMTDAQKEKICTPSNCDGKDRGEGKKKGYDSGEERSGWLMPGENGR